MDQVKFGAERKMSEVPWTVAAVMASSPPGGGAAAEAAVDRAVYTFVAQFPAQYQAAKAVDPSLSMVTMMRKILQGSGGS